MPRYSAGVRTSAGSTTLPIISLYSAAASTGVLREVGLFNTTATAVSLKRVRLSTTGTQGAGLTEALHNVKKQPALCTAFTTHSSTGPTITDDLGYRVTLGAAVGSGVIWTFGDDGIGIGIADAVELVTNAVAVVVATGTGQVVDAYFTWDE